MRTTGLGETGPSVSPVSGVKARLGVISTLHQLIDTLSELAGDNGAAQPAVSRDLPLLLDATETSKLLSLSRTKVCDMASRGDIPSIRIGRAVRIPRDLLLEWIADNCTQASRVSGLRQRLLDGNRTALL